MNRNAPSPFGTAFWCAYVANTCLMVSVSVMFRYSDFVTHFGGTEYELGWIVGIGMIGALAMRILQGAGIDRYGAGNIWLLSVTLVLISVSAHLTVTRIDSPWIYGIRMLYTISLAGSFGSSITFVSLRAPPNRTGETIGALGSSGFVGMAVGPAVADWIFRQPGDGGDHVRNMFMWAAGMSIVAVLATVLARASAGNKPIVRRRQPPIWWIVRRYHPGSILLIGMAMGLGINIPFSFLRPFSEHLGIEGIRGFFLVYAAVAFTVRISCRRFPDRLGVRNTVTLGMAFLVLEMLSFLLVHDATRLMIPAALGGVAHAFVFPAAMTGGSLAFPLRYRGLATTLMLTMFDCGTLVGQPMAGTILRAARLRGWDAYPTMYLTVSCVMLIAGVGYWLLSGPGPRHSGPRRVIRQYEKSRVAEQAKTS